MTIWEILDGLIGHDATNALIHACWWVGLMTIIATLMGLVADAVAWVCKARPAPGYAAPRRTVGEVAMRALEPPRVVRELVEVAGPERVIHVPVREIVEVETIVERVLPEDVSSYQTIVEIMTRLGVPVAKEWTWAIGRMAAKMHRDHYGVPPRKVDRQKTTGAGTHSFAGYPAEFVPEIEEMIRDYARQGQEAAE